MMFWDSVLAGLKVLIYWETYIAGLEYLAIYMIPMFVSFFIMMKSENEKAGITLLYFNMFVVPILQIVATIIFILTLSPIIFGFSSDAAWAFPWVAIMHKPIVFVRLVCTLIVAMLILTFIPVLGRITALHTLIIGGISLIFVLRIIESINTEFVIGGIDLVPGFWFSVGLIVIGGFMAWIGMMVFAAIVMCIEISTVEGLGQLIMAPIVAIFGFVPVFIYGAWLGAQVKGSF